MLEFKPIEPSSRNVSAMRLVVDALAARKGGTAYAAARLAEP